MNQKIRRELRRKKPAIIAVIIFWILCTIFVLIPLTATMKAVDSGAKVGILEISKATFTKPFKSAQYISKGYIGVFFKNWAIFTGILWGLIIVKFIAFLLRNQYQDIEHGSSDWSRYGEQYEVLSKRKGIILAKKNYLPVDKKGNTNVLIVGGSGSGKSAAYAIPNAAQLLGSYVFTDPKGEIYDMTAGYLKSQGYKIKVLNLVNPQYSDGYNPIEHIESEIDVDVIANTIVHGQKVEGSHADPFWDDSAEMLLKALIYYLLATRPPEEQNLANCAELVRAASINESGDDNILKQLMNQLPQDHPARMNYKSIELAPEKTYSSILSSLQSKLGKFDSREIAELTSTNTIDFKKIGEERTAVYVISSDTHSAYDFLLTIFFAQMIQELYNYADSIGGKLKVPTYFILDEFSNIGKIPDFDKKISTSRSRRISFSVILQNLDQLEGNYEKFFETIIGNCDTHLFLGSNSQKTVEYFSKALGEKTIIHTSLSVNKNENNQNTGFSDQEQIMARVLMTPDELRRLDNNLCIIYEKGLRPIKAKKYYYFKHKNIINKLNQVRISHNDSREINRGTWTKCNPRAMLMEEEEMQNPTKPKKEVTIDDLFDDEEEIQKPEMPKKPKEVTIDDLFDDEEVQKPKTPNKANDVTIEDLFNEKEEDFFDDEEEKEEEKYNKKIESLEDLFDEFEGKNKSDNR